MSLDAEPLLSDRNLALSFESLGDNCELGLVQRRVGVEPLGLFRFAGAPLRHIVTGLSARFEGMADPEAIWIEAVNDEYMVQLTKYGFNYHADVKIGEADPVALHAQQVRAVGFLIAKLIDDLTRGEKIFVFRQNELLSANDLIDLRVALACYGPGTLLWVQPARPGYPPGKIVVVDDTLMIGYVTRLASRTDVPDVDLRSWLAMLRNACALWPRRLPAQPMVRGPSTILFGKEGNASGFTYDGWSGLEDGYTWSINDRSIIDVPSPGVADSYRLEMDVVPYICPPALPSQALQVEVNGEPVHCFDPLPRGKVECSIPGRLIGNRETITITLHHPNAASPKETAGHNDGRRLAVSFYRLSLRCA